MRPLPLLSGLLTTALLVPQLPSQERPTARRPHAPNIVVIFVDDMGYADIEPFGSEMRTPNLRRLAEEGMKFTDFCVASAVCSSSRAALLTGCCHERVGIRGALGPDAQIGLHERETTIAELCKQKGYATACFGKWHLGHHPKFLPKQHGFDEYFGLPYSNDMWPLHPAYANLPADSAKRKQGYPALPLLDGDRIAVAEVTGDDQATLTRRYTERALQFLGENADEPFFLYLAHSMVHVPLFASDDFRGKSAHGLYGDVVTEIDWSVGQILDALDRLGLAEDTLVLFTSDNGPWLSYGNHAGSAGPLREGKGTAFEGGIRVPMLARWPGSVPGNRECREFASTIDVLPTIAKLIGADLPGHPIDGKDITPLLFGDPSARSPHEAFPCYYAGELQAVRDPRWKLHLPHGYATLGGKPGGRDGSPAPYRTDRIGLSLFDLRADPGETKDVAKDHPDVVARLQQAADRFRADLGDKLTGTKGAGAREPGRLDPADPRLR